MPIRHYKNKNKYMENHARLWYTFDQNHLTSLRISLENHHSNHMCYWFKWDNLAYAGRKPKTKIGKQIMIAITELVSETGEDVPPYTAAAVAVSAALLAFASTPHLCKLQLLYLLLLLFRLLSLHLLSLCLLLLLPPRCGKMQGCILCPCTRCQILLLCNLGLCQVMPQC